MTNYTAPPEALVAETFARLDAIDEPTIRAIVDLHQRVVDGGRWICEGCDFDGAEAEPPAWPCRTIEVIIETHLGVVLPTGRPVQHWGLVQRPADGSLDTPTASG